MTLALEVGPRVDLNSNASITGANVSMSSQMTSVLLLQSMFFLASP